MKCFQPDEGHIYDTLTCTRSLFSKAIAHSVKVDRLPQVAINSSVVQENSSNNTGLSNNVRDATQSAVKYLRLILENYVPWRYKELGTVRMQKIRLGSNLDLSKRGTDAEATWPCVISRFEVPVCSRTLLDVLFNSSLVQSFNKFSDGREDLYHEGPYCKVFLSKSKSVTAMRPFDFCTLMSAFQVNGTDAILLLYRMVPSGKTSSVQGSQFPAARPPYRRAETLLGISLFVPSCPSSSSSSKCQSRTKVWNLSHTRYPAGSLPPALADYHAFKGSLDYAKQLQGIVPALASSLKTDLHIASKQPLPVLGGRLAELLQKIATS
eukprot:gene22672-30953_t